MVRVGVLCVVRGGVLCVVRGGGLCVVKEMRNDEGFVGSYITDPSLNLTAKPTSTFPLRHNADLSDFNTAALSVLVYIHSCIKQ